MFVKTLLPALAVGLAAAVPTAAAPVATLTANAPIVESMVVGRSGTLVPARRLSASATTVRVLGRSCAVAAATPLAVLLDTARATRLSLGVRDYGHCNGSAVNSGELFVDSLAGEVNQGRNGWEYKVDERSGTTGAADTSGALGNGRRLAGGAQVLWFWCEARGAGCQGTLAVKLSSPGGHIRTGGALTVSVSAYDNNGRGIPVANATVRLGGTATVTGSSGRATLAVPRKAGRYSLSAAKPGLVPSFPDAIAVR